MYWAGLLTWSPLFSPCVVAESRSGEVPRGPADLCSNRMERNMIYGREAGPALDAISSCDFSSGRLVFDCAAGRCPL